MLFPEKAAVDYDDRIHHLVPGYAALHQIAPTMLCALAPDEATVLVAGAGTGLEMVGLAAAQPRWRFIAVDPSDAMLNGARRRATDAGVIDRIQFHVGGVETYRGDQPCDAALSLLVAQFVPDQDGQRAAYYAGIADALRPGAPLLLADLAAPRAPFDGAYRRWAISAGMSPERVDWLFGKLAVNFHPIDDARLTDLLVAAGFDAPQVFFQALAFRGHWTRKAAVD